MESIFNSVTAETMGPIGDYSVFLFHSWHNLITKVAFGHLRLSAIQPLAIQSQTVHALGMITLARHLAAKLIGSQLVSRGDC